MIQFCMRPRELVIKRIWLLMKVKVFKEILNQVNVSIYWFSLYLLKILIEKTRYRNINKNNYVNLSTAIPLRED